MTDEKSDTHQRDTSMLQQATEETAKRVNPKPKKGEEPTTKLISNRKKREGGKNA